MEEEELLLTQRDRDVLKVLHEVRRGHITQREAAEQLKRTDRWIRKLVGRVEDKGDRAIMHGLRGQPSTHKIGEKIEKRAVAIIEQEYADFGPTLASEYLARDHKITVSRETMRQWMIRAGLWKRRKQRIEEAHVWRQRRSCFGELVQWDTSNHDWLEGRGERIYLIAMIDDATSRAWGRFAPQDSTAENMRLMWAWLEKHGRFVDAYTDRAGLFETNRPNQRDEERDGKLAETQIGRALRELGIGRIGALSPQAKGRIERFFETAQDRLVKGMRTRKVCTLKAANEYVEKEYMPLWNERFTVRPASEGDAHRPLGKEHDLASILSHVEQRNIREDYTIRYGGGLYQVTREQIQPGMKGQRVRVEQRLDGRFVVRWRGNALEVKLCAEARPAARTVAVAKGTVEKKGRRRGGNQGWMNGFHLHGGPSIEEVVAHAYGEPWDEESE
jgi:transposase